MTPNTVTLFHCTAYSTPQSHHHVPRWRHTQTQRLMALLFSVRFCSCFCIFFLLLFIEYLSSPKQPLYTSLYLCVVTIKGLLFYSIRDQDGAADGCLGPLSRTFPFLSCFFYFMGFVVYSNPIMYSRANLLSIEQSTPVLFSPLFIDSSCQWDMKKMQTEEACSCAC